MTKSELIQKTVQTLERLPEEKISEVASFAEFILKTYDDYTLRKGIHQLNSESSSFDFLKDEPDLYDRSDLKERF